MAAHDQPRTSDQALLSRPILGCSGHSLAVHGVGSVVAPDGDSLHFGSRPFRPGPVQVAYGSRMRRFPKLPRINPAPAQRQLLLQNGLLQCTLGFARLSCTYAKHSLRNDLVIIYSSRHGRRRWSCPGVSIGRDDSGAARSVPRTNLILIVARRQTRSATTQGSPFDADLRLI